MSDSVAVTSRVPPLVPKSPKAAMMRALVPGWGQFYNGQVIKGFLGIAGQATLVGFNIYYNKRAKDFVKDPPKRELFLDRRNLTFWLMGAFTMFSMLDAYIDAHLHDFDTGPDLKMRMGALNQRTNSPVTLGISIMAKF